MSGPFGPFICWALLGPGPSWGHSFVGASWVPGPVGACSASDHFKIFQFWPRSRLPFLPFLRLRFFGASSTKPPTLGGPVVYTDDWVCGIRQGGWLGLGRDWRPQRCGVFEGELTTDSVWDNAFCKHGPHMGTQADLPEAKSLCIDHISFMLSHKHLRFLDPDVACYRTILI